MPNKTKQQRANDAIARVEVLETALEGHKMTITEQDKKIEQLLAEVNRLRIGFNSTLELRTLENKIAEQHVILLSNGFKLKSEEN